MEHTYSIGDRVTVVQTNAGSGHTFSADRIGTHGTITDIDTSIDDGLPYAIKLDDDDFTYWVTPSTIRPINPPKTPPHNITRKTIVRLIEEVWSRGYHSTDEQVPVVYVDEIMAQLTGG